VDVADSVVRNPFHFLISRTRAFLLNYVAPLVVKQLTRRNLGMAASVLLVVEKNDELIQKIVEKASKLTTNEIGPVIDQISLEKITR
jgi:hypothetical protein